MSLALWRLRQNSVLVPKYTRRHNDSSRDTVSPAGADQLRPLALGCPGKIIMQLGIVTGLEFERLD